METYNSKIATNNQVELIHVSLDKDNAAAEKWAKKTQFPWPTVMKDDSEKSGLSKYNKHGSAPHYVLIDKDGQEIATGKDQSFAKIKELTKS